MVLDTKNADNILFNDNSEIAPKKEDMYSSEVKNIISQVESGEVKTRTLEESRVYIDSKIDIIKAEYYTTAR